MTSAAKSIDILHLSDTHLVAGDGKHYGLVDNREGLARLLARASSLRRLDLVVCSGDLSDDGSAESYRALSEAVGPWAAERGARVVYAMGNHDQRAGFREVLGDGQHAPAEGAVGPGNIDSVEWVGGFRIVTLDSTVPGAGYGHLEETQLSWLRSVLAELAPDGTVLVLHHAPVPAETVLLAALELQNPAELGSVVAGSDVRLILAGHYHHALVDSLAGVPVVVAPGVANQADIFAPEGTEGAHRGSGAALVRLFAGGRVRVLPFTAPGPEDGARIFFFDRERVAEIARQAGRPMR